MVSVECVVAALLISVGAGVRLRASYKTVPNAVVIPLGGDGRVLIPNKTSGNVFAAVGGPAVRLVDESGVDASATLSHTRAEAQRGPRVPRAGIPEHSALRNIVVLISSAPGSLLAANLAVGAVVEGRTFLKTGSAWAKSVSTYAMDRNSRLHEQRSVPRPPKKANANTKKIKKIQKIHR